MLVAQTAATVSSLPVAVGEPVAAGAVLVVLEVMKMEHPLTAPTDGALVSVAVAEGDSVRAGQELAVFAAGVAVPGGVDAGVLSGPVPDGRPPIERADLVELRRRRALIEDAARPEAVAKRHGRGQRTARENVADLCDAGSFQEYGGFAFAAQEARRDRAELEARTPADGLLTGIGRVNGGLVGRTGRRSQLWPTTTRSSPVRRASATTPRRTASSSWSNDSGSPWCSSPRAAVVGRATPTCR